MAESKLVDDMKHCYENLILIDASANLTNKKYSRDLDAVIQRAQDSGKHQNTQQTHSNIPFAPWSRATPMFLDWIQCANNKYLDHTHSTVNLLSVEQ